MTHPSLSVIVSTYEWPEALDAVLLALSEQTDPSFEVVVADDGSGPETASVVRRWAERLDDRVRHVWQPDEGFRRARILNLAALEARGGYLVFLDGDVLVRRGFLAAVRRGALPGWFLAGKRLNLGSALTKRVLEERLPVWRWSALRWLSLGVRHLRATPRETGRPGLLLPIRDQRRPWRPEKGEFEPPYDAYGFFMGVSRADFERVNGFDLRYEGWGGEDEDLAARLRRAGLRCGWPGPRATLLHLDHPVKKGLHPSNQPLVQEVKAGEWVEAVRGLRELRAELRAQASA